MPQFARTNTPPGDVHSMVCIAPSGGVLMGQLIKVNDTVGMVFNDADEGEEFVLWYIVEKVIVPKAAGMGQGFLTTGMNVYYNTLGFVTPIQAAGLYRIGVNTEIAAADVYEVEIDLHGICPLVEV
jgi:hypothetical protein